MQLFVLFGQREEEYDGQHAPEAIDVIDSYTANENPEYMDKAKDKIIEDDKFVSLDWFEIELGTVEMDIRNILIAMPKLRGQIKHTSEKTASTDIRNESVKVTKGRTPGKIVDTEVGF